jgi:hypothetical protein
MALFEGIAENAWTVTLYLLVLVGFISWLASRVPQEARYEHRYLYGEGAFIRRKRSTTLGFLVALLVLLALVLATQLPSGWRQITAYLSNNWWPGHLTSPVFLLFFSGWLAEIYFLGMLLSWLWPPLLAQAEPQAPVLPDWLVEIIVALIGLAILVGQLLSLPSGPGALLALLASLVIFLGTAWLTWKSFPNTPLRSWFCRVLIGNFWTPYQVLWGLVWSCLRWGWVTMVWALTTVFEYYKQIVVSIPTWVQQTIFVRQPVRRLIRAVLPPAPAWVPGWLVAAGDVLIDTVDTFIEIIEWVVVAVVVLVLVIVATVIWVLVTVIIVIVYVLHLLVCLLWMCVVVILSGLLVYFWVLPLICFGIIMFNLPSFNPFK